MYVILSMIQDSVANESAGPCSDEPSNLQVISFNRNLNTKNWVVVLTETLAGELLLFFEIFN